MSKADDQLKNNKTDLVAAVAKGGLGAIPFAGGLLAEIAGTLIPNQRIDRIAKFVSELNDRLEAMSEEVIERLRNDEEFIDLIEESFIRASRANSDERRGYIVNIVQNGISDEDAGINNAKYLLGLLSELNDSEVIWLRYFHEATMKDKDRFRALHENVLKRVQVVVGSSEEVRRQGAVQASYKEHLERLGLIKHNIRMNRDRSGPEYDKITGQPKVSHSQITVLGDMLLSNIGLL
jgi:hypothetical protein